MLGKLTIRICISSLSKMFEPSVLFLENDLERADF